MVEAYVENQWESWIHTSWACLHSAGKLKAVESSGTWTSLGSKESKGACYYYTIDFGRLSSFRSARLCCAVLQLFQFSYCRFWFRLLAGWGHQTIVPASKRTPMLVHPCWSVCECLWAHAATIHGICRSWCWRKLEELLRHKRRQRVLPAFRHFSWSWVMWCEECKACSWEDLHSGAYVQGNGKMGGSFAGKKHDTKKATIGWNLRSQKDDTSCWCDMLKQQMIQQLCEADAIRTASSDNPSCSSDYFLVASDSIWLRYAKPLPRVLGLNCELASLCDFSILPLPIAKLHLVWLWRQLFKSLRIPLCGCSCPRTHVLSMWSNQQ